MRNQIMFLLKEILEFQQKNSGTDFQNQLIKYKLAVCQSVVFDILKDRQAMDSLETAYLLNQKADFQNPEYINFLFDYYFRRISISDFNRLSHPDSLTQFDIAKNEIALISNDTVRQLALLHLARKAYNSSWVNENSDVLHVYDSLANQVLHDDIRRSAATLANRLSLLEKGEKLPIVSFLDLFGVERQLSKYHGKYVLLDFWYIGCRPCQADLPILKKLHTDFTSNLSILSVNPRNTANEILEYKTKEGAKWEFLTINKNQQVLDVLCVEFFPTYYLLDPEGIIILVPKDFTGEVNLYELVSNNLQKSKINLTKSADGR
jgi:thiol-disulfide isomerase/thioredoxin